MKIIVTELIWEEGLEILKKAGEVLYDPDLWKTPKLNTIIEDAQALIVRNQTNVNRALMESAPLLKVVGRLGVGLDNINLDAARELGISVTYARNANAVSVTEYVFAVMLAFARKPCEASADVKQGHWNRKMFTGIELHGKNLGLVGIGEISTRLAARARVFGMNVLGYDPFIPPYELAITEFGVQPTSLDELLRHSDFVSLHVPLNDSTLHMIDNEKLALMKPTAYIINSARGGVIDEQALYNALSSKSIAGAALDVMEKEPTIDSPLFALDNIIITPHVAGLTEEAQVKTSVLVAREVVKVLRGQPSNCLVV